MLCFVMVILMDLPLTTGWAYLIKAPMCIVPSPPPGYEGRYTNKMGKVKEGSATFWRTSRLAEVDRRDVLLRDVFREVGITILMNQQRLA